MKQIYILTISMILTTINLHTQNIESFEDETDNAITFTTNGQSFTIESGTNENFIVKERQNFGWDGGADTPDDKYVDNSANSSTNDGTSFTIKTTDGADISINSLYLFVGTYDQTMVTNETLTIEGKRDGNSIYTISKTSGFAYDGGSNGFTFIDFSNENGVDNSATNVDELVFSSTSTADYLALDYLIWSSATLSTSNFEENISIKLFPNPSSELIQLSGLNKTEKYKIYNVIGSEIVSGSVSNNESIDIKNLTNGLYFLTFDNGNEIRFVKE